MRFRTMKNVTVITGGAGGMGLATARVLGRDHRVLICDVRQERLDAALAELRAQGIDCDASVCDITDRSAVDALVQRAAQSGTLASVVHTAGLSPQMAEPETIMKVNALGTVNIVEACLGHAREGFALVNVASMAAHMMPSLLCPTRAYPLALSDADTFLRRAVRRANLMPKALYRRGMAYGISKHFVIWLSRHSAARFGEKGARVAYDAWSTLSPSAARRCSEGAWDTPAPAPAPVGCESVLTVPMLERKWLGWLSIVIE